MIRPALALAALIALPALAAETPPAPAVDGWLRARAGEHQTFFRQLGAARSAAGGGAQRGGGGLWRELGPGQELAPAFVAPTSLAPLVRAVQDGVVYITALGARDAAGNPGRSSGSGFVISPDGLVVTNNHVVARATALRVQLADGREFSADVAGRDPATDVALLRLRGDKLGKLPTLYLGDSDRLEVGEWVVAIGNPFGLDHSVSHGMVSAKDRVLTGGVFDEFLQTDALINPGNSGGPLFNMRGEVVGVNTAIIRQGQGIGFAVPINLVKDLLPNLLENGRLERGYLGITVMDTAPRAVVQGVVAGSPADRAGIRIGDTLVAVNGRPAESYRQVGRRVSLLAPGTEVKLTLLRQGQQREVSVQLARRPEDEVLEAQRSPRALEGVGLAVRELSPEVASVYGLGPYQGMLVTGVLPGSVAQLAGLREGDLVVEVNRKRVRDRAGLNAVLERGAPDGRLLVRVQRGDALMYFALER